MTLSTIAILGAGNMGSSLINGMIKNGYAPHQIWASDANEEKLKKLKSLHQINITPNNQQALQEADIVIFAIKPQIFSAVAKELAANLREKKPLVISIAAGIKILSIKKWFGSNDIPIIRAMPNTPALIGCGATALFADLTLSQEQKNLAETILRSVGLVQWLSDENLMDTVTALSGSGPAYFFLVMEALYEAAEQLGLAPEIARLLTLETAIGAAKMALESGTPLDELRKNVTSPGGTTEKAISVLEENNIKQIFKLALTAAKERSEELAKILGDEN